jgi:hypothetical protein
MMNARSTEQHCCPLVPYHLIVERREREKRRTIMDREIVKESRAEMIKAGGRGEFIVTGSETRGNTQRV